MSLQEDGMVGLIVLDITAALEGDEGTHVRRCSFREREGFRLDKIGDDGTRVRCCSFREREDFGLDKIGDDCARETMRACSGIFPCRGASEPPTRLSHVSQFP
jgi:hypothetical protein